MSSGVKTASPMTLTINPFARIRRNMIKHRKYDMLAIFSSSASQQQQENREEKMKNEEK
jgi:hypothetical protein